MQNGDKKEQKVLAVITARGGSKRIPKKNIRPFLGRPIMEYSIEAAIESGCFDEVMVSTDSEEIAEIAQKAGAKVPFYRSESTSDDHATTADVLLEVIRTYEERGIFFGAICCLYPTAPFVNAFAIKEAMKTLIDCEADTVLPVVRYSFPPQRSVVIRDNMVTPRYPEDYLKRSQDLEPYYHDCGQFYCMRTESLKKNGAIVAGKVLPYVQQEIRVQDIDTEEDWQIAEMKYRILKDRGLL